jgi:hypothetical protein
LSFLRSLGGEILKGRKPTKKQKEIIRGKNLNPGNWLVIRNLLHQGELHITNRYNGKERVLKIL